MFRIKKPHSDIVHAITVEEDGMLYDYSQDVSAWRIKTDATDHFSSAMLVKYSHFAANEMSVVILLVCYRQK